MNNPSQTIDRIAAALDGGPFKVSRDVVLSDGTKAEVAASRTYFSWKGLVILSQHILVRHVDNATQQDAKALFDAGFHYGKKVNRVPLLRGMQFGYMIIPVIVGESPDDALVKTASQRPVRHFSIFEYPVVVDLSADRIVNFGRTAIWGAFFFSDMREVVDTYIKGSMSVMVDPDDVS